MAKLNKEQTAKFNKLYDTVLNWGEGENCIGLFEVFGGNLDRLTTCVENGDMEILCFDGCYYDLYGTIPVNAKTKGLVKKIVEHLIDNDFDTLNFIK